MFQIDNGRWHRQRQELERGAGCAALNWLRGRLPRACCTGERRAGAECCLDQFLDLPPQHAAAGGVRERSTLPC
eukprot:7293691-Pyramimonas_sp.AAC.1